VVKCFGKAEYEHEYEYDYQHAPIDTVHHLPLTKRERRSRLLIRGSAPRRLFFLTHTFDDRQQTLADFLPGAGPWIRFCDGLRPAISFLTEFLRDVKVLAGEIVASTASFFT